VSENLSGLSARIAALLASPKLADRRGPSAAPWPLALPEPADVAALYAATDGLALADGTTLLPRGDIPGTTAWLTHERSLDWPHDLVVVGEREDLVIVLDFDLEGARSGGGVLEAPTDALSSFRRYSRSLVGYLELRAGLACGDPAPEVLAVEASARRDRDALRAALAAPMYPGSERQEAHAWLVLGGLTAAEGDESAALAAFERSVAARVKAAARGAGDLERAAAWRACAATARESGPPTLADLCTGRAGRAGAK